MSFISDLLKNSGDKNSNHQEEDKKSQSQNGFADGSGGSFISRLLRGQSVYQPTADRISAYNLGVGRFNTLMDSFGKWYDMSVSGIDDVKWDDAQAFSGAKNKAARDWMERAGSLRKWANENKDMLGADYQAVMDDLQRISTATYWVDKGYKDTADVFSKFDSQQMYDIAQMSTEELKAKAGNSQLEEWRKAYDDMYALEGPYGLLANDAMPEEERAQYEARYNEILETYGSSSEEILEKIEQMEEPIAYTTKDGQNVTWQMLYDSRYASEDLASRLAEYSQNEDWEEMSRGIYSADDTLSDYDIIFSLQQSMMPYDRETAEASGVDMAQWEETEAKRRYIENKYGVDLHADIYDNTRILGQLMAQTAPNVPGEKDFFDDLSYLTDDENAVLSYIYNTQGRDAALAWHESRERMYADRQSGVLAEIMSYYGQENPFLGSLGSVALGIGGSFEQASDVLEYIATGEVGHNVFSEASSALRSGTMQKVDLEIGNFDAFDFLYGTTMSGVDSFVQGQLFGRGAELMLGLGAAAQATKEAKDRGLSDKQAFWTGITAGVAEGLFEHWSLGNFRSMQEVISYNGWDIAKNIGKSMLVNASEETLTEIANIVYDLILNGDFSQYETTIRQYQAAVPSRISPRICSAMTQFCGQ